MLLTSAQSSIAMEYNPKIVNIVSKLFVRADTNIIEQRNDFKKATEELKRQEGLKHPSKFNCFLRLKLCNFIGHQTQKNGLEVWMEGNEDLKKCFRCFSVPARNKVVQDLRKQYFDSYTIAK